MCAAYNLGMQSSDAKYKIYMHQDVFIRNEEFLADIWKAEHAEQVKGLFLMERSPMKIFMKNICM